MQHKTLCAALSCLFATTAIAQAEMPTVIVTGSPSQSALELSLDPRIAQQPIPANDGASFLKNIPGFSIVRKGGTDGDPVLRGSSASRLGILVDGMEFHGGCSARMDPPTAYVFPEAHDEVRVIKGPQSVRYGNGHSAGVVLFEHDAFPSTPAESARASAVAGSWGRQDGLLSLQKSTENAALEFNLTHVKADNYEDGAGNAIHAAYARRSATLRGQLKLSETLLFGLDGVSSAGRAAYADRGMDGSLFDRRSLGITLQWAPRDGTVESVEARVYRSAIDHVMDNYSLRQAPAGGSACMMVSMMNPNCFSVMNPDRITHGGRVAAHLWLNGHAVVVGADHREEEHRGRMTTQKTLAAAQAYVSMPRTVDYRSQITGAFIDVSRPLGDQSKLVMGARVDEWNGERFSMGKPLAQSSESLQSAFMRVERAGQSLYEHAYIGLGLNQRPLDYWEAVTRAGLGAQASAKPEQTLQVDLGALGGSNDFRWSISGYVGQIQDYLLVSSTSVQNVDARRVGLEADARMQLSPLTKVLASLAWVRAENTTLQTPLAQTPPLEVKVAVDHQIGRWSIGGVVRLVAKQDRIHPGFGTIVGLDRSTETPGFATLGLHASHALTKDLRLNMGIDNVLDHNHFEHLNRSDASIAGYLSSVNTGVNEPGRTVWMKVEWRS
ncbi:MAG: hypothetical protein RJA77_243 [Pseudomonadota bacterium]